MIYQIEFIQIIPDRDEPTVMQVINGEFRTIEDAKTRGIVLFTTVRSAHDADGFQVRENGGPVVEQWFPDIK